MIALLLRYILKVICKHLGDLLDNWLYFKIVIFYGFRYVFIIETDPELCKGGFEVLISKKLFNKLVGYVH